MKTIPTIQAASNQSVDAGVRKTLLTASLGAQQEPTGTIMLSWQVFGATACTAVADPANSQWSGPKSASLAAATFTQTIMAVSQKTTVYLTCTDAAGHTAKASTEVFPVAPASPPTTFSPRPIVTPLPIVTLDSAPAPTASVPHPVSTILADTALGATAVSVVSLGAVGISTSAEGIGLGGFLVNILTMLSVIGNVLLETLGLRRRRYPWGTVFEIHADQPLELAIVRLKTREGRLVETRVTDQTGRVGFLPVPGEYLLDVTKTSFVPAPPQLASGSRYQPVSDGSSLKIPDTSTAIQVNIPMEPAGKHQKAWKGVSLQALQFPLLLVSLGLASGSAYLAPSFWHFVLVGTPFLLICGEWLAIHPHSFGVVHDQEEKPLAGIAIQLVESTSLKVMATQTTDRYGRYSFLVRPGRYHLRIANREDLRLPPWLHEKQFTIASQTGGLIAPSFKLGSGK